MKKILIVMLVLVTSMGIARAESNVYSGTATISMMNGNAKSGTYDASFDYDDETYAIDGEFDINWIHSFKVEGELVENGSGEGAIVILLGLYNVDFTCVFTNVTVTSTSISFTCTATPDDDDYGISVFSFTGTK